VKHKIRIKVEEQQVLAGHSMTLPKRLLRFLFGDFCEILILTPGKCVQNVEIQERKGE
jgi:hypothetical protein